jgi:hypothetical protein
MELVLCRRMSISRMSRDDKSPAKLLRQAACPSVCLPSRPQCRLQSINLMAKGRACWLWPWPTSPTSFTSTRTRGLPSNALECRGSVEMKTRPEHDPIFVHASPRSGSTYFFNVLRRNHFFCCVSRKLSTTDLGPGTIRTEQLHFESRTRHALTGNGQI